MDFIKPIIDSINDYITNIKAFINNNFGPIYNYIREHLDELYKVLQPHIDNLMDFIRENLKTIYSIIRSTGIPYLSFTFLYTLLFLFGGVCWVLVVTPRRLSISLQKLMFTFLLIYCLSRILQNIFDFLENFEFFATLTIEIAMFASSSFDIFGNYLLFCSYGLIMAFWGLQWICMRKANQIDVNAPAPKKKIDESDKRRPHFLKGKTFSLASIDMDEYGTGGKKMMNPELIGPTPEISPFSNVKEIDDENGGYGVEETEKKWFGLEKLPAALSNIPGVDKIKKSISITNINETIQNLTTQVKVPTALSNINIPFLKKTSSSVTSPSEPIGSVSPLVIGLSGPDESAGNSPAMQQILPKDKMATSATPRYYNLERYSKRMSILVSCTYVIINMIVLACLILFVFGFVIFGFGTFDSFAFKTLRLMWILFMAFAMIFGMTFFGVMLFLEQRKKMKKQGLGGKTWAVAKVSIFSMSVFCILMLGNILTTLFEMFFYDIYIENFFGVKWMLHILLSSLEMFAAFYLMFTLRPVQLSCKCCTFSFCMKCCCSMCCCCLMPVFEVIKASRRDNSDKDNMAYGGLALDNLVEKLDKNSKENYIPYNQAAADNSGVGNIGMGLNLGPSKEEMEEHERQISNVGMGSMGADSSIMLGIVDDDSEDGGAASVTSPGNMLDFNLASDFM